MYSFTFTEKVMDMLKSHRLNGLLHSVTFSFQLETKSNAYIINGVDLA